MTVGEFLDQWLETAVRSRVSPRTADGYSSLLDRYIRKPLGQKKLEKLEPLDIQKAYAAIQLRAFRLGL
ncbi:MAG: hypothetical protein LC734_09420 [Acidobacteria bacterium]|nr:hypothetical protein [Acidobacteriota bacterium]